MQRHRAVDQSQPIRPITEGKVQMKAENIIKRKEARRTRPAGREKERKSESGSSHQTATETPIL